MSGDGAFGLTSLIEKMQWSNHLQMLEQRQHVLLNYFIIQYNRSIFSPNGAFQENPIAESYSCPSHVGSMSDVQFYVGSLPV